MTKNEILNYLQTHKTAFRERYQIRRMALFGSYARGENNEQSDVDIAIETPLSDYFKLYDLKEELETAFGTKVDIVRIRETMNEALKKRIAHDGLYI